MRHTLSGLAVGYRDCPWLRRELAAHPRPGLAQGAFLAYRGVDPCPEGRLMLVATLIADPARAPLRAAMAEDIRARLAGGALRWLAADEAAEFSLAAPPDDFEALWSEAQAAGVDLAVQTALVRRRRVLLADMDSTMIEQECIDELADMAGIGAHVAAITARAMNGQLDFEAALTERVALLRDLPEAVIGQVLAGRIRYRAGGAALVATMRAAGGYAALVSGGFTAFTAAVAAHLGFDENRANRLEIAQGRLTGRVLAPILGREAKVAALEEICARLGCGPEAVLAVGDGANDLGMLARAGAGVALHAKPAVAAQCRLRINHGDLTALLYLQGYRRDEFVG
jgi:phosphoserine phosphatase